MENIGGALQNRPGALGTQFPSGASCKARQGVWGPNLRPGENYFNNNNNNNTSICKAHNVSIRAESEAPLTRGQSNLTKSA